VIPGCLAGSSWLVPSSQSLLALQDQVTPTALGILSVFSNTSIENFHPAFLVGRSIGVKVDYFAVVEANAEAFLDEHVSFLFFCEAGLSSLASLSASLFLRKSATIIDELGCIGEIDCGTRLTGRLVVCSELASHEFEVTTTPVLVDC
jgi:hypothetical protein